MQGLNTRYSLCLATAAAFLVFVHTHTDEIPIVLGLVLLTSGALALVFPKRFPVTGLILGAMLFVAETLVHFGILHAPWIGSAGIPYVALVGYVPAFLGVLSGAAVRRLMGQYPA